jgi:hypothetical protein
VVKIQQRGVVEVRRVEIQFEAVSEVDSPRFRGGSIKEFVDFEFICESVRGGFASVPRRTDSEEEKDMPRKPITIWVETDTLVRLKKAAVLAGRSLSNHADSALRRGLDREEAPGSLPDGKTGPGFDPEPVRKAVEAALRDSELGPLKAEIIALERTLYDAQGMKPAPVPEAGFSWTKDQAAYLIYSAAVLTKFFEEYNAAWNMNDQQKVMTRKQLASDSGQRAVQKYLPGGEIK